MTTTKKMIYEPAPLFGIFPLPSVEVEVLEVDFEKDIAKVRHSTAGSILSIAAGPGVPEQTITRSVPRSRLRHITSEQ